MVRACFAHAACVEVETPCASPGFVSWPYSVIQIGTLRWNELLSVFSNCGNVESVTFGYRTFWSGGRLGDVGYGWCAHASNLRPGTLPSSRANVPGAMLALLPLRGLSRPRAEVSPIATWADGLPALIPA